MSADGRLAGYQWVSNPRNAGNPYAGQGYYAYKPRILLHMTVSSGMSVGSIAAHSSPPQLWANCYTGDRYQTIELDRAGLALYQPPYGYHWCNKHDYTLQTELIGVPVVSQATYTDAQCRWIGEQVIAPQARWLRDRKLPIDLNAVRYHANTSGSASVDWAGRFTEQQSADFNGVMAHIDEWGNDHWDCSAERIDLMVGYAKAALGDGVDVSTYAQVDDRIDIVGVNSEGHLYHKWYEGKWQPAPIDDGGGWEWLTAKTGKEALAAGPASCAWFGDQFHVFYPRVDGQGGHLFIAPNTGGWVTEVIAGQVPVGLAATVRTKLVKTS